MPSAVVGLLKANRKQLVRLIEAKGAKAARKLYEESRAELEKKLARLKQQGKDQSFTAHHNRMVLLQVKHALLSLDAKLKGHLDKQVDSAALLANRHLVKSVKALEKKFAGHAPPLQVEQAAVFQGVYKKVKPSLLDRHKKSLRFYGKPVVDKVKLEMAKSMLQNETVDQAVDRIAGVGGVFAEQRWRAERIARTEMAEAYGQVQHLSMMEMQRTDLPDLKKKWIAHMDDRTGEDSKELHGTVLPLNQEFTYTYQTKKGPKTLRSLTGVLRPNDRCTVIPWRDGWVDSEFTRPL